MTSPTLRAALERAARFSRVTADMAVGSTRFEGGEFVFVNGWREGVARPAHAAVDAAMAAIVRSARAMLGRHLAPTRVQLTRPTPTNRARFEGFFRCPLHYESAENVLAFLRADVERPVPGGHDRLASVGDQTVAAYLARLQQKSVADQIREVLVDALAAGEPDVDAVAAELAMSGRTLQRRLREEGTSFRDVLASTRRDLAEALLASGAGSVTEIGHRLGFSETAAFSRAFRRWTGQSPASWRAIPPRRWDPAWAPPSQHRPDLTDARPGTTASQPHPGSAGRHGFDLGHRHARRATDRPPHRGVGPCARRSRPSAPNDVWRCSNASRSRDHDPRQGRFK